MHYCLDGGTAFFSHSTSLAGGRHCLGFSFLLLGKQLIMNHINTIQAICRIVAALFIGLLLVSCNAGSSAVPYGPSTATSCEQPAQSNTCSCIQYNAPSGAANNIVFKFDKSYPCGQFINGDWWVSPEGVSSAGVTITEVLPLAADGFNGFEVNPSIKTSQGFDRRVSGYNGNLKPALPLLLNVNASVVKAVSLLPLSNTACRPCVQYAAVLTVSPNKILDSANTFRPGYYGTNKSFYKEPIVRWTTLLPKHTVSAAAMSAAPTIQQIKDFSAGVRLDHLEGWTGEYLHPQDTMSNGGTSNVYGAQIATNNAVAISRLMLSDVDLDNPLHKAALVNYLQMSVDYQSMANNGVTWPADGGHGSGRKLPLLVGGLLLDNTSFDAAISKSSFQEDTQLYISTVTTKVLWGRPCTDSGYWSDTRGLGGARDCRDPYQLIDGGGLDLSVGYQVCCTSMPFKYTALAVSMLNLKAKWVNTYFFDYVNRWVATGTIAAPDTCAPYDGFPGNYLITYGPSSPGVCITGAGRLTSQNNLNADSGYYRSNFGDKLWTWSKTAGL